jgi:two-component system sensor histidine kinase PilS (NtrC family)
MSTRTVPSPLGEHVDETLTPDASGIPETAFTWRPLRVFSFYRVTIASGILVIFLTTRGGQVLSVEQPTLFLTTALGYLLIALALLGPLALRRPGFHWQVYSQLGIDVAGLGLLIFASGSIDNGLSTALLVAVAGGSILVGMRMGALVAAVATIMLFGQQFYSQLELGEPALGYTQVGFLGLAMFATALVGGWLANRARESQALAERRGVDIENLQALNNHIVQRLQTGVVVLDADGRVRLTNQAARELLGEREISERSDLNEISPSLRAAYERWRTSPASTEEPISTRSSGPSVMPRFRPIGQAGRQGCLVFLDNLSELQAQVQQAKLASLGRLTASIAHEIRNPLGAIANASQLLEENEHLKAPDRRLVDIIRNQCRRLNTVVESVLQLSRRQAAEQAHLDLDEWLEQFIRDWQENQDPRQETVEVSLALREASVWFDPDHLGQVLENLMRNAREHGGDSRHAPRVHIVADNDEADHPYLEVQDNGDGVPHAVREQLFEPFFTTSASGTGLGLYLCREICEANHARLHLIDREGAGACFRITFAGPGREEKP